MARACVCTVRALIHIDLAQPLVQNSFPSLCSAAVAMPKAAARIPRKPAFRHAPAPAQIPDAEALWLPPAYGDISFDQWPLPDLLDFASRHAEICDMHLTRGIVDRAVFATHLLSIPEPLRPTRVAVHSAKSQGRALQQIDVAIAEAQAYWASTSANR